MQDARRVPLTRDYLAGHGWDLRLDDEERARFEEQFGAERLGLIDTAQEFFASLMAVAAHELGEKGSAEKLSVTVWLRAAPMPGPRCPPPCWHIPGMQPVGEGDDPDCVCVCYTDPDPWPGDPLPRPGSPGVGGP